MKSKFRQRFFSPTRRPIYMDMDNPIFRIYSPSSMSAIQPSPKLTSIYNPRVNNPTIKNLLVKKYFVYKNTSPTLNSKPREPISRLIKPHKLMSKNLELSIFKTNYKQNSFKAEKFLKKKIRIAPGILPEAKTSKQLKTINLVDLVRFTEIDEELSESGNRNYDIHLPSLAYRSHDT